MHGLKENYGTLSETINDLKTESYTMDFNIHHEKLRCQKADLILSPDDFAVHKVYRFEGESNPGDKSILFAISSSKFNVKDC